MKKKFLTLQVKLFFVVLFVLLSFLLFFSCFYYVKSQTEDVIEKKICSTNMKTIESVVQSRISLQRNIVRDYSTWDDMYQAVKSKNIPWITTYAESFLSTYGQKYLTIFDKVGNTLYMHPPGKILPLENLIKKMKGNCGDFFIIEDSIPIHITWSIITTTADTGRVLSGSGYLVVAKEWDTKYMAELSKNTGLLVLLHTPYTQNKSFTKITYDLKDIDGNIINSLYFEQDDFIVRLHYQNQLVFYIAVFGICVVFLIFWLVFRKIVTKPVAILLKTLKTGNISLLEPIKSNKFDDEWTLAANLIEENTRNTQKLKELVATKDKFFDVIAHDLRSPFNAIVGFSEMLANDEEKLSVEERKEYSQYVLQTSRNANKLLNTLLEWARLQTGRWTSHPQPFAINKLIDNVVSFHQSNATHCRVNLLTDIKESVMVYADEQMIETIIRNLVSNAIKFTQSGGFVKIEIRKQENDVVVVIRDNGKGMSPSLITSLFKIGENVVVHDVSGKLGTGLGLILCKELVEKNGGMIWAKSEPTKGSRFYFTIPLVS